MPSSYLVPAQPVLQPCWMVGQQFASWPVPTLHLKCRLITIIWRQRTDLLPNQSMFGVLYIMTGSVLKLKQQLTEQKTFQVSYLRHKQWGNKPYSCSCSWNMTELGNQEMRKATAMTMWSSVPVTEKVWVRNSEDVSSDGETDNDGRESGGKTYRNQWLLGSSR